MAYGFAAAGTAGHIYPALAVAEELVLGGVAPDDIVFFGGDRFETTAVPEAGFVLESLELLGLQRSLSLSNLRIPAVVWRAVRRSQAIMVERAVRTVLATGSYVTIPIALAARRAGIPYVVQEQNADAGLANRLAARGADAVFTSFAATAGLVGAHVGNPIRPGVLDPRPARHEARRRYGLDPDVRVLGVVGGTLGSAAINAAVAELVHHLSGGPDLHVLHIVGDRFRDDWAQQASAHPRWHVIGFEREMRFFYAAADVVLSRSGGGVAELLATGTPAILVPGGFGSKGHQAANADQLVAQGAAVKLPETDLGELATTVAGLMESADTLGRMSDAAGRAGRPDAAAVIAEHMRELHDRTA